MVCIEHQFASKEHAPVRHNGQYNSQPALFKMLYNSSTQERETCSSMLLVFHLVGYMIQAENLTRHIQ